MTVNDALKAHFETKLKQAKADVWSCERALIAIKEKQTRERKSNADEKQLVFYCEDCKKGFDSDSLTQTGNSEESFATCPCCGLEELPCITRTEFNQTIYNHARFKGQKPYAKLQDNPKVKD